MQERKFISTSKHNLNLTTTLKGVYKLSQKDNYHYFLINASIINRNDSIFNFWIHNCSVWANFIIDSKYFTICVNSCDRNSRIPISLKHNEVLNVPIIIRAISNVLDTIKQIKIGFIVVDRPDEESLETLWKTDPKSENILWTKQDVYISGGDSFTIDNYIENENVITK